jgi:peptide deformylase
MTKWSVIKPPFVQHKKKVFSNAAKASEFIFQIGESGIIRSLSKEVTIKSIKSEELKEKIEYLKSCLLKYRKLTGYGRGLTAVQVGIRERFSVIFTNRGLLIIINPIVKRKSKKMLEYPEGCISASPIIAPIIRPSWIEFEYVDENGLKRFWNNKDDSEENRMMNRVFQHEIDHMDGIINIDKVLNPSSIFLESDPDFYTSAKFKEL